MKTSLTPPEEGNSYIAERLAEVIKKFTYCVSVRPTLRDRGLQLLNIYSVLPYKGHLRSLRCNQPELE